MRANKALNCWEYMLCGKEPEGTYCHCGVCPAATNNKFDRIHGGQNAGRACWVIADTVCQGRVQDTTAKKYRSCGQCDFYNIVKQEEGDSLLPTIFLLKILEDDGR
jgi:hypothetical protein